MFFPRNALVGVLASACGQTEKQGEKKAKPHPDPSYTWQSPEPQGAASVVGPELPALMQRQPTRYAHRHACNAHRHNSVTV